MDITIMSTCQTPASRHLDQALDQSFPASDPAALTQPSGDARDEAGCCCGPASTGKAAAPKVDPPNIDPAEKPSCCGGSKSAA